MMKKSDHTYLIKEFPDTRTQSETLEQLIVAN